MSYSIGTSYDAGPVDRRYLSRETSPHAVSGAVALTLSMVVGGWILYARSVGMLYTPPVALNFDSQPVIASAVVAPPPPAVSVAAPAVEATPYGALAPAPALPAPTFADQAPEGTPAAIAASDGYIGLFDPTYSLGSTPASLEQSAPLLANFQPMSSAEPSTLAENVQPVPTPSVPQQLVQDVPLPARRPPELASPASHSPTRSLAREMAQQQNDTAVAASAPPLDQRSFFQKLFGGAQPSGPVLAYASAEDGAEERKAGVPLYDHSTAVYDISSHIVYLPDGTRLEAHSGLGDALDDPRYVAERMRGPTPPGTYDLQPREQLFHGVQALRLIPVGNSDLYGRAGLLAHTYMLGQNGDSFGCVSFRDYNAFLHAYESGEIKRITVVARLD
jgi:hypothetical protein